MLDLSKLKALELPKKEIEVEILGEVQKVEISALDDESAVRIAAIHETGSIPEDEREIRIRKEILKAGVPGISDDEINVLMTKAGSVVTNIMVEIRDLTAEYAKSRSEARSEIEKNSEPAEKAKENA